MNKIILITLIESLYVYYMYNMFKTKISFHNPIEILIQKNNFSYYLKHSVSSGVYESKICPFGKFVSILIIIWLWLRLYFSKESIIYINFIIFLCILIGSFVMNLNSFIYLIPLYVYELFIYPILKN